VLQLRRDPPGASLILAGAFLMDSDLAASERELARRGLDALQAVRGARGAQCVVLVAGLGLGLTLRELLTLPGVGRVDVVEIFGPLVAWNRGPLAALNGRALDDPRVSVRIEDLRAFLRAGAREPDAGGPAARRYDLLLLDIDNGPTWLSLGENAWLYTAEGLEALRARATPRGVIAFWATEGSPAFEHVLAQATWAEWRRNEIRCPVGDGQRILEYVLYLLILRT